MKWVRVGKAHFNTALIQAFTWSAGHLLVWWHGEEGPEWYADPDRAYYLNLCCILGVRPVEEDADGEG